MGTSFILGTIVPGSPGYEDRYDDHSSFQYANRGTIGTQLQSQRNDSFLQISGYDTTETLERPSRSMVPVVSYLAIRRHESFLQLRRGIPIMTGFAYWNDE